jgi:hypothetical protein
MLCRYSFALMLFLVSVSCCEADERCRKLDAQVTQALQQYARKSTTSGDIMDVVSMFAPWVGPSQIDPRSIRPEDLQVWKSALDEQVQAGIHALQDVRNYESAGCGAARRTELVETLSRLNEGLSLAQSQLLAITPIARAPGYVRQAGQSITTKRCHTEGRKSNCPQPQLKP